MPLSEERKAELLRRYGNDTPAKPVVLTAPQEMTEQERNAALLDIYSETPAKPTLTEERKAELLARYGKKTAQQPEQNILERIGSSKLGESIGGSIQQSADIMRNERLDPISKALQVGGQGVNIATAPIAAGAEAAFGVLPDAVRQPINKFAGNVAQTVGDKYKAAIEGLADTRFGKSVGEYGMNSPQLQEGMKEASDNLGAIAKMVSMQPVGKAATAAAKPVANVAGTGLEKTGEMLIKSADKSVDAAKTDFATKLYTPKETPTAVAKMAGDIEVSGLNQVQKYAPDAYKAEAISALKELPIKPSNTLQKNYNVVRDAVNNEANKLSSALAQTPVKYKPQYINDKIDDGFKGLLKDPLIVGDAETVASRVAQKAKEITANNPNTPEGLLKSRQEFDAWARSKKGGVFDTNDTALSAAVKQTRNIMNQALDDIAPNAAVKDSLRKQSYYLDAMDNMSTKLSAAPKTRASLLAKSILPEHLRLRLGGAGAFVAGGALGASSSALPALVAPVAGAVTGYGLYKTATSPLLRKALGEAIMRSGKAIKP